MDAKTKNEIVQAAQKIIFGQEGNYSSVNANDNGAVSVGKVQWHAGRALALLKKICAAESGAASILGAALYGEITAAAAGAWNARTVNAAEKAAISRLLSTDAGKRVQDAQAEADVGAYVDHGLKVGVEDPAALCVFRRPGKPGRRRCFRKSGSRRKKARNAGHVARRRACRSRHGQILHQAEKRIQRRKEAGVERDGKRKERSGKHEGFCTYPEIAGDRT